VFEVAVAGGGGPDRRQLAADKLERLLANLQPLREAVDPELALQLEAVAELLEGLAPLLDRPERILVAAVTEADRLGCPSR
jgi:hypothetical protein